MATPEHTDRRKGSKPEAGPDYPKSYGDFCAWFPDDDSCLDYLDWLRWAAGFLCPHCACTASWRLTDGRRSCAQCKRRVSVLAGTIFHGTRTPLSVWFTAAWNMTSSKNGVSAKTLHRDLGFGSYQTAWAMCHRYRSAMVMPGRDRLSGDVEVDETVIGGVKPGKRGRGAEGKVLIVVAVERRQPKGFGRCRLQIIANAETVTLRSFLLDHVEPGSRLVTDGWKSYPGAASSDYKHKPIAVKPSGKQAHEVLPGVHRVASLVKRWLLGTHQGAVDEDHLQAYLDEFTFRFNRRRSKSRGMLFYRLLSQAVRAEPVHFQNLVAKPKPKAVDEDRPIPPKIRRLAPPSLHVPVPARPWR